MRIISGKHKGRRINAPRGLPVRPTTDMAKEALFNILNNNYYFEDLVVLDLFSGTGNISFEFASRGSSEIVAVDKDYRCIKFISKMAEELGFSISAIKSDVFKFIEKINLNFDIIFVDPPYSFTIDDCSRIASIVFQRQLLNENGVLIIEHSKHTDLSALENFKYMKKYGGSVFSFLEPNKAME
ncbi:16S rRNA (guanine(966)-N(2))-methyltransferase RsmD [uncultured Eudoraea sp.]|uniref:16S rRNA (guanine(966)-N(2))-methyltransferase RsmD n=1 Tax=uncultured Eudoraea sp. TaxID=1035614 RepID=UPI002636F955|nr:16S rRNA (guanine(966)-N(2))-methyltransferase RsmD [uncultured Eudoraea sp.]